jgi:hypothetical protein
MDFAKTTLDVRQVLLRRLDRFLLDEKSKQVHEHGARILEYELQRRDGGQFDAGLGFARQQEWIAEIGRILEGLVRKECFIIKDDPKVLLRRQGDALGIDVVEDRLAVALVRLAITEEDYAVRGDDVPELLFGVRGAEAVVAIDAEERRRRDGQEFIGHVQGSDLQRGLRASVGLACSCRWGTLARGHWSADSRRSPRRVPYA